MNKEQIKRLNFLEKEINKLQKQRDKELTPLKKEYNKLKDIQTDEKNTNLIGKCFVFKNAYSSSEKWDLFIRIIGVNKGELITEEFEKTPLKIEYRIDTYRYQSFVNDPVYKPIDGTLFALKKIQFFQEIDKTIEQSAKDLSKKRLKQQTTD